MSLKTNRHNQKDIQAIVERLLEEWDLWKSGPQEWRARCPFHKGDNITSFRVKANGSWRCFRCDEWGDLTALVMKLEKLTFQQAREYVSNLPSALVPMEDAVLPPYEERKKVKAPYELLHEAEIVLYKRYCPQMLLDRGFDERCLTSFEIGYDFNRGRIVIPVRDVHRKLVGITLRLDFETEGPKYWHDHFDKSLHLYGFYHWKEREVEDLYLVEGQLDAVRMHQLGLPAVAIMGSSISEQQVGLLLRYARCSRIVTMYDNDEAGEKATLDSIRRLCKTSLGRVLYAAKYDTKDPGELRAKAQIKQIVPWHETMIPVRGGKNGFATRTGRSS